MPEALVVVAWISLVVAVVCAGVITADILAGHRQKMAIMNVVWPVTALWSGPVGLLAYCRFGRLSTKQVTEEAKARGEEPPGKKKPFWAVSAVAATHCGSGCTLGDLIAEWGVFFVPALLTWFGYRTLFSERIFATWVLDFVLAFLLGIVFQYFTIVPMRHLGVWKGIWAAMKADTPSLVSWQLGMYGWMAIAVFVIFGHEIHKTSPVFWFMMQIAMVVGFLTAYPVNWWLVRAGVKEKM
jgi:hypothetical protein